MQLCPRSKPDLKMDFDVSAKWSSSACVSWTAVRIVYTPQQFEFFFEALHRKSCLSMRHNLLGY